MLKRDPKLKSIRKMCALILGIMLAFSHTSISASAESVGVFEMTQSCGDVTISMSAPEGVFPEGAYFEVCEVSNSEEEYVEVAVSAIRDTDEQVAASYVYDITVYDADGNEIEPDIEYGQVSVTFSIAEAQDSNLQAKVYHVEGSEDSLSASELEATVSGDEVTVVTDSFSYYTVEFIYENTLCYTLKGDEQVELSAILDACGIEVTGEITDVVSSNEELFTGVCEDGVWYICACEPFDTEESLKVTIDGKVYTITVTDSNTVTYLTGRRDGGYDRSDPVEYTLYSGEETLESGGDADNRVPKYYYVSSNWPVTGRINVTATDDAPAYLILGDGVTLTVEKGISVPPGACLYICATTENNMGKLIANGENNDAGIGGSNYESAGMIVIDSGIVEATGGKNAAGIGGGNNGGGGTITINGGTITATGGINAAGIGSGNEATNSAEKITIAGGTITATGGANAAGIGGGRDGNSGEIMVCGGKVTATGGNGGGAGIGGGSNGMTGEIKIDGGKIAATGKGGGAGIGGGNGGNVDACRIYINDGTISAKSDTGKGINAGNSGNIVVASKFGDISFEDGEIKIPKSGGKKPTSNTNPNNSERKDNEDDNPGQSAAPAEPLMKSSANNGDISGICTYEKQGPLCAALFKSATPAGFKEAFSFNLNLDKIGKAAPNHDKKVGKLVLNIPKQYQKAGRTFAIIGIDEFGKTKVFYVNDADDKLFTTNINISGYAFSLIYSDSIKGVNTSGGSNGDYVVKQGDSLSSIARKLKKTVRYLAQHNDIDNPDRLSVGQVLKY